MPAARPYVIDDPSWLASEDPWLRFVCIIARAQVGDFGHADVLVELALHHADELDHVGELAGAILPHDQLRRLFVLIGTDRSFFASIVANESYWLDFAEACIPNRFCSELRPLFFSEFVERWDAEDGLETGPYHEYDERVRRRIHELRIAYPGVAHFAYGEPLHPRVLMAKLGTHVALQGDELWAAAASISTELFRLETLTGAGLPQVVEANDAYGRVVLDEQIPGSLLRRVQLDPEGDLGIDHVALAAAVACLEHVDFDHFEPGQRYFHGHRVPSA